MARALVSAQSRAPTAAEQKAAEQRAAREEAARKATEEKARKAAEEKAAREEAARQAAEEKVAAREPRAPLEPMQAQLRCPGRWKVRFVFFPAICAPLLSNPLGKPSLVGPSPWEMQERNTQSPLLQSSTRI